MSSENIGDQQGPDASARLASPSARLGAALFDGWFAVLYLAPIAYYLFFLAIPGIPLAVYPFAHALLMSLAGLLAFTIINGYFLHRSGQTLGKKLVGTQIVTTDGALPGLPRLFGRRYLPLYLVSAIPVVGGWLWLVDALFVMRKDHRCVHDLIAGTQVVIKREREMSGPAMFMLALVLPMVICAGIVFSVGSGNIMAQLLMGRGALMSRGPSKATQPYNPKNTLEYANKEVCPYDLTLGPWMELAKSSSTPGAEELRHPKGLPVSGIETLVPPKFRTAIEYLGTVASNTSETELVHGISFPMTDASRDSPPITRLIWELKLGEEKYAAFYIHILYIKGCISELDILNYPLDAKGYRDKQNMQTYYRRAEIPREFVLDAFKSSQP